MTIHHLKTWPSYFCDLLDGRKNFEYRKDDRCFEVGDTLILEEYEPPSPTEAGHLTGRDCVVEITYILRDAPGLPDGFIVMGIQKIAGGANR